MNKTEKIYHQAAGRALSQALQNIVNAEHSDDAVRERKQRYAERRERLPMLGVKVIQEEIKYRKKHLVDNIKRKSGKGFGWYSGISEHIHLLKREIAHLERCEKLLSKSLQKQTHQP